MANQIKNSNNETLFIKAPEVAVLMDVSRAYAYRIIKQLNADQKSLLNSSAHKSTILYFIMLFALSFGQECEKQNCLESEAKIWISKMASSMSRMDTTK